MIGRPIQSLEDDMAGNIVILAPPAAPSGARRGAGATRTVARVSHLRTGPVSHSHLHLQTGLTLTSHTLVSPPIMMSARLSSATGAARRHRRNVSTAPALGLRDCPHNARALMHGSKPAWGASRARERAERSLADDRVSAEFCC